MKLPAGYVLPPYLTHGTTDAIGPTDLQKQKSMFAIVDPTYSDRVREAIARDGESKTETKEGLGEANRPDNLSTPYVISFPESHAPKHYRRVDGARMTDSEVQAIHTRAENVAMTKIAWNMLPQPPPEIVDKCCSLFRVCELVWRQNNFYTCGYILCAGLWNDDTKAELNSWIEHRTDHRMLTLKKSTREGEGMLIRGRVLILIIATCRRYYALRGVMSLPMTISRLMSCL